MVWLEAGTANDWHTMFKFEEWRAFEVVESRANGKATRATWLTINSNSTMIWLQKKVRQIHAKSTSLLASLVADGWSTVFLTFSRSERIVDVLSSTIIFILVERRVWAGWMSEMIYEVARALWGPALSNLLASSRSTAPVRCRRRLIAVVGSMRSP